MKKEKRVKKPLTKARAKLSEMLARQRGGRILAKRFLIVCEDDKSAPNYFHALKKHFNLSATSIEIVGSGGHTQPVQVVNQAIKIKVSASDDASGTLPFDEVWCVIDGDYGPKIFNARVKAIANEVKLAISTMCFEYWILLHFEENASATIDCDTLVSYLKKTHLAEYEKGKCDFHEIVPNVHEASKRAEQVRKPGILRGDLPEKQNPCSEVYMLINAILHTSP